MDSDAALQSLHDRATRGEPLSAEEQARLEAWYGRLDREEAQSLTATFEDAASRRLRGDIHAALRRVHELTESVGGLMAANDDLRLDIAGLKAKLAQRATASRA